ncbi:MAG: DUF371 domain-containing protein [Thermoprotei archaeon]
MMHAIDVIYAKGHPNILATHRTTFEITKEKYLTKRGNCIIGIDANKSVLDLDPLLKKLIRTENSKIILLLESNNVIEEVHGKGSSKLTLNNPASIVIRKSNYISDRTLMINADKAAADIRRDLIEHLRKPNSLLKITVIAEVIP